MISFLSGKIQLKTEKYIILDVNGVGYKVFLSQKTLSKLPEIGASFKCFCYLNVRETALDLYGFLTKEELEFFEILEEIRGIGPKVALEISSLGPLEKLKERILAQDERLFDGIPGIGKKKAMAIILELTGKLQRNLARERVKSDEAEESLVHLGFSRQKVKQALSKIPRDIKNIEDKIKEALRILGR